MPSGVYAKGAKQATTKTTPRLVLLHFLNYLAFLRPAADQINSVLPWVVSRGRSYGFLWIYSIIQQCEEGQSNSSLFSSKLPKTMRFARRKEERHSQKQEFFMAMMWLKLLRISAGWSDCM
jgi:recombinational DNA repair protein (RecF pathway)